MRKRSKSPVGDNAKPRRRSRPRRGKRPPPVEAKRPVVAAAVPEEGEVTDKPSTEGCEEAVMDGASSAKGALAATGSIGAGSSGNKGFLETAVLIEQDSGLVVDNQHSRFDAGGPFYLVTGRKSGRRAKSSH